MIKVIELKNTVKSIFSMFLLTFLLLGGLWAVTITITGNWSLTIDETDLQSPQGGSDLNPTYESASNVGLIDITIAASSWWDVYVSKSDNDWDSSLHLYIRRTGGGSGKGASNIQDGTTYQEITDTEQYFFRGNFSRSIIPIQLKIEGVSAQLTAKSYTTTVIHTVY